MADVIPPDNETIDNTGHTAAHDNISDMLTLMWGGSTFQASDTTGFLAWTIDPAIFSTAIAATNNTLTLIRVNIRNSISVSNVCLYVTGGGVSLTSSENYAGLYNSSGTLIASTADQTSSWASSGLKTMALSGGPYGLTGGTFAWIAFLANTSSTTPTFTGTSSNALEAGLTAATARTATNGTGTSITGIGNITPGSNVALSAFFWAALS